MKKARPFANKKIFPASNKNTPAFFIRGIDISKDKYFSNIYTY